MSVSLAQLQHLFPHLNDPGLLAEIQQSAIFKAFQVGETLLCQGDPVGVIPLVIKGRIKVIREDITDKELLMYYIEPGESCILSITAMLSFGKSKVTAICERPSEVMILPRDQVLNWMSTHKEWMQYLFGLFDKRMSDLVSLIGSYAFQKVDERLWHHLNRKAQKSANGSISITHQELALELGTAREVISRQLKELEKQGKLRLERGCITLLDIAQKETGSTLRREPA